MNIKLIVGLVCVFLATSAIAVVPTFDELDVDEDGMVSLEETQELEEFDFLAADADEDGELNREEYENATAD